MKTWYDAQLKRDAEARAASQRLLGEEAKAFADAMQLIEDTLALVVEEAPIVDLAAKRKISFATHGFNLLWAAWDQMLAGRYDASRAHSRSISEVPDFLDALDANPHLAHQMGVSKVDVEAAWKAIRKQLKVARQPDALELVARKEQAHRGLQHLSHVSAEAVNYALSPQKEAVGKLGILRPGGMVSEYMLRPVAIDLACAAMDLSGSTIKSFFHNAKVLDLWQSRGLSVMERHAKALADELTGLRPLRGDFDQLVFLRSIEELSNTQEVAP